MYTFRFLFLITQSRRIIVIIILYQLSLSSSPLHSGDSSRYGVNRAPYWCFGDFPRYYLAFIAPLLNVGLQRGLHRYKPDFVQMSPSRLAIQLPDKEFRLQLLLPLKAKTKPFLFCSLCRHRGRTIS